MKQPETTPCQYCGKKGCEGDCPGGLAALRRCRDKIAKLFKHKTSEDK